MTQTDDAVKTVVTDDLVDRSLAEFERFAIGFSSRRPRGSAHYVFRWDSNEGTELSSHETHDDAAVALKRYRIRAVAELVARATHPSSAQPARDAAGQAFGIYVASKSHHGPMWREFRRAGRHIISTWIDESDKGATSDWADLWTRCQREPAEAKATIVYREDGEVLKGALVEVGCALGAGRPVFAVGEMDGSWCHHPLVTKCSSLDQAFALAAAQPAGDAAGQAAPAVAAGMEGDLNDEQDAWNWLAARSSEHPNDRDYSSDQMVDAFMAGRSARIAELEAERDAQVDRAQIAEAVLAAPDPQAQGGAEADGWQPIETAPRDGTLVDLWVVTRPAGPHPGGSTMRFPDCRWIADELHQAGWWTPKDWRIADRCATHWRRLPPPPAHPGEREEG